MKLAVDQNNIQDFYNQRYENNYMEEHSELDLYRVKDLLRTTPVSPVTILDYGCGQGGWIQLLSSLFPEAKIYGIDISDKAIEKANQRFPQYNFLHFDGEKSPFDDNSFDLIFSYHVLEHVYELEKTVKDISRLLRKDGHLCLIFPCGNEGSFEESITRLVHQGKEPSIDGRIRFFYEDSGHIRRMKSQETIDLFAQNGVKIYKEYYAHQLFGAIELIGKSEPSAVKHLFDINKSINRSAKIKLLLLRAFFIPLNLIVNLYLIDLREMLKISQGVKRAKVLSFLPLKFVAVLFGKTVNFMALLEWLIFKEKKNGSEMYLNFRK